MRHRTAGLAAALSVCALPASFPGAAAAAPRVAVASELPLARPPRPGDELVLSVVNGETRVQVRPAEAAAPALSLPLLADLRDRVALVPFGVEERCAAAREGADIAISCAPGTAAAGILLRFDARLPRGAALEAVLETQGSPGFRAELVAPGADADAAVPLAGAQRLRFPGGGAAELVILAPRGAGSLRLAGLRLAPAAPPRRAEAGAWAWEPDLWRDGGAALIRDAAARGVKLLSVTLEIADGRVLHRRALGRFVRAARRAGIAVEAVEGDPHMVLEAGLANGLARARAIARYQAEAPAGARLAGVQFDIEPYVLPAWGTPAANYRAWSAAVVALAGAAGGPVHLALPFWIADDEDGARFLEEVRASVREVTAMTYRTDPATVTVIAEPLLHWGARTGIPIRLALEASPVDAEAEERFVPAESGTIALVERAGTATALLLDREAALPGARMYRSRGTVQVRPERISFLGDEARMRAAARLLAPAFAAWPSFAGISYHGLRWSSPPRR